MKIKCELKDKTCDEWFTPFELRYMDPKFEVYSYRDGDGIWGSTFDEFEEVIQFVEKYVDKETAKELQAEFDKWGFFSDLKVEVDTKFVSDEGYTLRDLKGNEIISNKELKHMCMDSVITLPDGRRVEPDHPDSPLSQMGII